MKRLMLTLSSLALFGVACGRVSQNGDEQGADDGDGASGGASAGSIASTGGKTSAGGKTGTGGKSSGTAGKSSGTAGKSSGTAGKSSGIGGGTPSEGGAPLSTDTGFGGAEQNAGGAPPGAFEACERYCTAYSEVCPQAGMGAPDQCTTDCVDSLKLDNSACNEGKRAAYDCIANAFFQAGGDCGKALTNAKIQCGGATPRVGACNATCTSTSFEGDGTGCHLGAECKNVEVHLDCLDVNDGKVPCTCSIGGKVVWDIATGYAYSKAACLDEALFRLCAKELP
jgi:hypothetical protein